MHKKGKIVEQVNKRSKIPSLIKLAALKSSEHLNIKYAIPTEDLLSSIVSLPIDTLSQLFPFLHFRWLDAIVTKMPSVRESALPFFTASMRREEDFQRSKKKLAGQIPLINIYDQVENFKVMDFPSKRLCLENASPIVSDGGTIFPGIRTDFVWPKTVIGQDSIVSKDQFKTQFEIFTEGQLKGIDWNNVFVAGGCVSACLLPVPKDMDIRRFYHEIAYATSDIDIFLYDLDADEATEKVADIITAIKDSHPDVELSFFKSSQTITLLRKYPYRCTQVKINVSNLIVFSDRNYFDGTDVLCLPRFKEAINTRVNIINPSLECISFRRVTKYQSRGFAFAMPDFLSVPFGGREQSFPKLGLILSYAMMNLLHDYNIKFDHSDNLASWQKEYNNGVTRTKNNLRALEKSVTFPADVSIIGTDLDNLEWDSSCGVYGVVYFQDAEHDDLEVNVYQKTYQDVSDLEEVWDDEDFESPWTWDGAPEFKDWSYAKKATEIAKLSFEPIITKLQLNEIQSEQKKSFCITTGPDPQGFVYNIRFKVCYSTAIVNVELGELPAGHDNEDPLCSIVAIFAFKGKKDTVYLDFTFNFTLESRVTPMINAELEEEEECNVEIEIRSLKQTIPWQ